MKHLTIVTVNVHGLLALAKTCASVKSDFIIAGYGHGSTSFTPGTMPNLVGVLSGAANENLAVMSAVKAEDGYDIITVVKSGEYFPRADHDCYAAIKRWLETGLEVAPQVILTASLRDIPGDTSAEKLEAFMDQPLPPRLFHIVPYVEDSAGKVCRGMSIEARTAMRVWALGADVEFGPKGFQRKGKPIEEPEWAILPEVPILHQPVAAALLEGGDAERALRLANENGTAFEKRLFLLARAEMERRAALDAFRVLFTHYSLHEELWRLHEWMKLLPYDLEESPEMPEYRRLLTRQVGHLNFDGGGARDWYADGSPHEVADIGYAQLFWRPGFNLMTRFMWLIDESRRLGFKRVVEFGSVDGISLFPLQARAPDIEWHGVEVNPLAVAHGHKVAAEAGTKINLHHAESFAAFAASLPYERSFDAFGPPPRPRLFDAAVVFEVLEHNTPTDGQAILLAAESVVRPGGRVFISTPNGNWSAHDERTRKLELNKDHVFAFTEKRMRAFLKDKKDVRVEVVENPNIVEGNSNVQASYLV